MSRPYACQVCHARFERRPGGPSICPPCLLVIDRLPDTDCAWTKHLTAEQQAERAARVAGHAARLLPQLALRGLLRAPAARAAKGGAA